MASRNPFEVDVGTPEEDVPEEEAQQQEPAPQLPQDTGQPVVDVGAGEPVIPEDMNTGEPGWFSRMWQGFQDWRDAKFHPTEPNFTPAERDEITKRNVDLNRRMMGNRGFSQFSFGGERAPQRRGEKPTEPESVLDQHLLADPEAPAPDTTEEQTKEGKWGEVLWDTVVRTPALFKRQYQGARAFLHAPRDLSYIMESAAQEGVAPEDSFALEVEAYTRGKTPADYYVELLKQAEADPSFNEAIAAAQEEQRFLDQYQPRVGKSKTKYYAAGILEATIQMAPSLLVAGATRSPTAGAALMGGQVFADQYAQSVQEGRTHGEATMDALVFAAAETLTERIPLGVLTKEGGGLLKRTLRAAGAEGLQEPLTQFIETGYQKAIIDDEMTLGEAMVAMVKDPELRQQLIDAGIIGAGAGGALAGVAHPMFGGVTEDEVRGSPPQRRRRQVLPSEAQGEIMPEEARQLGLTRVDVTSDLLDRVGAGEPLTTDEEYTLTSENLGQFVGAPGSERVVLNDRGMKLAERLRETPTEEQPTEPPRVEEQRVDLEGEPDVSESEAFGAQTEESRRSVRERLDRAARRAEVEPTEAQKEAGNYRKGHVKIQGLDVAIENPRGSTRTGTNRRGRQWQQRLRNHYGYIKRTNGKDGDHVDAFIGNHPDSDTVVVVNQKKDPRKALRGGWHIEVPKRVRENGLTRIEYEPLGEGPFATLADARDFLKNDVGEVGARVARDETNFDEHKVMLGFRNRQEAIDAYRANTDKGRRLGSAVTMTMDEFKTWLDRADQNRIAGRPKKLSDSERLGIERARRRVEDRGDDWENVQLVQTADEFMEMSEQYGRPTAISELADDERPSGVQVGFLFDDEGTPVAYAPSGAVDRMLAPEMEQGAAVEIRDGDNVYRIDRVEQGGRPRSRFRSQVFAPTTRAASRVSEILSPSVGLVEIGTFSIGVKTVTTPEQAAHVFAPLRRDAQESVMALVTGPRGKILQLVKFTTGDIGGAFLPTDIMSGLALSFPTGSRVWFTHNHPSGYADQSGPDIMVTRKLDNILSGTGVTPMGMIVVAPGGNASFLDPKVADRSRPIQIEAAPRTRSVSVTQRKLRRLGKPGPKLSRWQDAVDVYREMGLTGTHALLMNPQMRIVGSVDLTGEDIGKLRTGDVTTGAGKILGAMHEMNADEMYLMTDQTDFPSRAGGPGTLAAKNFVQFAQDVQFSLRDIVNPETGFSFQQYGFQGTYAPYKHVGGIRRGLVSRMTVRDVQEAVRPYYRAFRTAPIVRVVETIDDLPEHLQRSVREARAETTANGIYDQGALADTAYIIAANTIDERDAVEVLVHEIVGHYGLHQVLPADIYSDVMDKIFRSFPKEIREIARVQELDLADPRDRQVAAEEYVAYTAQKVLTKQSVPAQVMQLLRQLVQAIQNVLRRISGRETMFTDGQVMSMIAQAHDYVTKPGGHVRDQRRGVYRHAMAPSYYSQMFDTLNSESTKSTTPENWKKLIEARVRAGKMKQEEVDWSGIMGWLDEVTWLDAAARVEKMGGQGKLAMPKWVQQAWDQRDELNAQLTQQLKEGKPGYSEWVQAATKLRDIRERLSTFDTTGKVDKLPKEAVLGYVHQEGVRIVVEHATETRARTIPSPEFNERYPDVSEPASEEQFREGEWAETLEWYVSRRIEAERKEIFDEHDWDDEVTFEDVRSAIDAGEVDEEVLEELGIDETTEDKELLNRALGRWDETSPEEMEDEAIVRAEESVEEDVWEETWERWSKKNSYYRWEDEIWSIHTDSDGDYVVGYSGDSSSHLSPQADGNYYSTFDEAMAAIDESIEEIEVEPAPDLNWNRDWGFVIPGANNYQNLLFKWDNVSDREVYQNTTHWKSHEWNFIVHARINEREDRNGKPAIFVEELQSDWHQEIRKSIDYQLSSIYNQHHYDEQWWREPNVKFGGDHYDGTPLSEMRDEARRKVIKDTAGAAEVMRKLNEMRRRFLDETGDSPTGLAVEVADIVSGWDVTYERATEILEQRFVPFMDEFRDETRVLVREITRQLDSAGMTTRLLDAARAAGWQYSHFSIAETGYPFKPATPGMTPLKPIKEVFAETLDEIRALPDPRSIGYDDSTQGWGPYDIATEEWVDNTRQYATHLWAKLNRKEDTLKLPRSWADLSREKIFLFPRTSRNFGPDVTDAARSLMGSHAFIAGRYGLPERHDKIDEMLGFHAAVDSTRKVYEEKNTGRELAPFERSYQTLVMKHLIREGVLRGHDRVFLPPGTIEGTRNAGGNLSKKVTWRRMYDLEEKARSEIEEKGEARDLRKYERIYSVNAYTEESGYDPFMRTTITGDKLWTVVGRQAADLILLENDEYGEVTETQLGNPIMVGNNHRMTGNREIYDGITVHQLNGFLKKYGARVKETLIPLPRSRDYGGRETWQAHGAEVVEASLRSQLPSTAELLAMRVVTPEIRRRFPDVPEDVPLYGARREDDSIVEWTVSPSEDVANSRLREARRLESTKYGYHFKAWEIEFTDKLKKAARDRGFPLFSRRKGNKSRSGDQAIDGALDWANENIGPQRPSTAEKIQQRVNEVLRTENKAAKMEQAIVDQFAGIKWAIRSVYGEDLPAEISGYKQAHFTTSVDAQMYAFMAHGLPEWRDGITQLKDGSHGYLETLDPVASNIDEYFYWKAAKRAQRLKKEGRERLFTDEAIDGLLKMGESHPEFEDVLKAEAEWKRGFLDWAQEAGVINGDTRHLWEHDDHVPFYRLKADEIGGSFSARAGMGTRGIANQINPIRRLKGGKEKLGDLLENQLINFTHLASTAMKNRAMSVTIENLVGSGIVTPIMGKDFMEKRRIAEGDLKKKLRAAGVEVEAMSEEGLNALREMWTIRAPQGEDVVSVLVNGKKHYYRVHEETLLRSLTAINEKKFTSLVGRMGMWAPRKAKRLFTSMITLDPAFMAANWFRDVFMSFANSRHAKFPRLDRAATGFWKAISKDKEMLSMMAAGGAFYSGYINALDPAATAKSLRRAMRRTGVRHRILDAPVKLFELYNDLGAASENANRIGSAYVPAIKAGASTAEAVWETKDLMNFSKHGDHAIMQFLVQTVPFMNARVQGLVRYGQRWKEAPGITFTKSFLYALAAVGLWLGNKDDDRYKALPEEEKDLYHHFWINGKHWRLPKAFELGMLFGTVPERMMEYYYSNEDDAGKLAIDRMKFVLDQVYQVWDPVTVVPMPQLLQPYVETQMNYDFFFQGPIVPEYMQDIAAVKPDQVYRPSTSPTARELANIAPRFMPDTFRNPMMIEHLIRGYFGTLGAYAMMISDDAVRKQFDYPAKPALRWSQIPITSRFYRSDEPPTRTSFEDIMYRVRENARQIDRAVSQMQDREMDDEVEQFLDDPSKYNRRFTNQEVLDAAVSMEPFYNEIRRMRKEVQEIWEDAEMSPHDKLMQLNDVYRRRMEAAREAYMLRPGTEPTAMLRDLPVGTLALRRAIEGKSLDEATAFLREYDLNATADLLGSLPRKPGKRMSTVIEEAR